MKQKKQLIAVLTIALFILFSPIKPPLARAGSFYSLIVGLAQQVTQFAQLAEEIGIDISTYTEVIQQVEQLEHEVQMIEMMIKNLENIGDNPEAVINTIEQLVDVVNQGQVLSYAAVDIDDKYAQMYPGYEEYRNQDINGEALKDKFGAWSQSNMDNIKAALKAAGIQQETIFNEREFVRELKAQAEDENAGRKAVLQAGARLAAQENESLLSLRELTMTGLQLQANWMAKKQDNDDIDRAHTEQIMSATRPVLGDESNILDDFQ